MSSSQTQAQAALLQTQIYDMQRQQKQQIQALNSQIETLQDQLYQKDQDLEQLQADYAEEQAQRQQFEARVKQLEGIKFEALKKADQAEAQKMALKADIEKMKEYYEREKERLVDERCKGLLNERKELQKRVQILEDVVNRQDVEQQLQNQEKDAELEELKSTVQQYQSQTAQLGDQLNTSQQAQQEAAAYQASVQQFSSQIKQQQDAARKAQQEQQLAFQKQQQQLADFKRQQLQQQQKQQQEMIQQQLQVQQQQLQAAATQFTSLDGLDGVNAKMNSAEAVRTMQNLQMKADALQDAVQENDKAFIRLQKFITNAMKLADACVTEKSADAFVPSAQLEEMNRQQNELRGELSDLRVTGSKDKKRADAAEQMVTELEAQISALEQELLFYSTGNGGAANRREAKHQALFDAMSGTKTVGLISGNTQKM